MVPFFTLIVGMALAQAPDAEKPEGLPLEVAEVLEVADPPPAVEVHGVRRRGDVAEQHVSAADRHPPLTGGMTATSSVS